MTIRINQTAIDFTLETETTIADLARSLAGWAGDQNQVIVAILADGKAVTQNDSASLSEISEIGVETIPSTELDSAKLDVITEFFELLSAGLSQKNLALIAELHKEFESLRSILWAVLQPLGTGLNPALSVLEGPWTDTGPLQLAASLVVVETKKFRRELSDPAGSVFESLGQLEASLDSLGDLGALFQTGRDRDGFDAILKLFTILEDLNRRATLVFRNRAEPEATWMAFHTELQPVLQEAEAALSCGDYILLTDLIEYELTPQLRTARAIFVDSLILDPASDIS